MSAISLPYFDSINCVAIKRARPSRIVPPPSPSILTAPPSHILATASATFIAVKESIFERRNTFSSIKIVPPEENPEPRRTAAPQGRRSLGRHRGRSTVTLRTSYGVDPSGPAPASRLKVPMARAGPARMLLLSAITRRKGRDHEQASLVRRYRRERDIGALGK